jgi:hypothetical protein
VQDKISQKEIKSYINAALSVPTKTLILCRNQQ